jgi:hypothetical protein
MDDISEGLKELFESRISGELEWCTVPEMEGKKIYWKPLTGAQQKTIQVWGEKSNPEGVCMHVKLRALNENREQIFKDDAIIAMMTKMDFRIISKIYFAMQGINIPVDEIEKN